jgi:hypothetical protein
MTTTANTKPVSLKEEKEAAKEEQKRPSKPITPSNWKRVQRVHELKRLIAPLLAEIEENKAFVVKEMERKGVKVLTRNGVEVVSMDEYDSVKTDSKDLERDYPEIAAIYVHHSERERINWKKDTATGLIITSE